MTNNKTFLWSRQQKRHRPDALALFWLPKFARSGSSLLLLLGGSFPLWFLHQENRKKTKQKLSKWASTAQNQGGISLDYQSSHLPLGGQRAGDGEEGVQSALGAALPALHDLLTAVTYPVLTAQGQGKKRRSLSWCVGRCKDVQTFSTHGFDRL